MNIHQEYQLKRRGSSRTLFRQVSPAAERPRPSPNQRLPRFRSKVQLIDIAAKDWQGSRSLPSRPASLRQLRHRAVVVGEIERLGRQRSTASRSPRPDRVSAATVGVFSGDSD